MHIILTQWQQWAAQSHADNDNCAMTAAWLMFRPCEMPSIVQAH